MAKAKPSVFGNISGNIGDIEFAAYKDKQVIRKPYRRKASTQWTERQRAAQREFSRATAYAKSVLADPQKKTAYAAVALARHCSEWNVALGDALRAPVIADVGLAEYHGLSGEHLWITAIDDVEVTQVTVTIRSPAGSVWEEGIAQRDGKGDRWIYAATITIPQSEAAVTIEVAAVDQPGNRTVKQVDRLLRRMDPP